MSGFDTRIDYDEGIITNIIIYKMTVASEIKSVHLGTYLFSRLLQVNSLKSIFGVPGDFNLNLLEHMYKFPELQWIGNCNELNAGYAADGYSRVNKFGVLITTFGVGELSALNAISGSFTENVAVLHIVGTSATVKKNVAQNIHHLIPNKSTWDLKQDHYVYEKLVEPFCCINESLKDDDLSGIQDKIDHVIETIYQESKPGYLFIPSNMPDMMIPVNLSKPLKLTKIDSNPELTNQITEKILAKLYSKSFAIVADSLIKSQKSELNKFIESNNIDCFSTLLSKSIINEDNSNYHGMINGKLSTTGSLDKLSKFECILHLGVNKNEINNFNQFEISNYVSDVVEIGKDYIKIDNKLITNIDGELILQNLFKKIEPMKLCTSSTLESWKRSHPTSPITPSKSLKISQSSMGKILESNLNPNDVIICEMCSFLFEIPELKFPQNSLFISQNFYGSIGYALPATLGASLAVRDSNEDRRIILIQGDGSAQMTIQELSSYIRYNITPTILLLNNEGYSVERICCGPTRSYNDIQPHWDWLGLFKAFGDVDNKSVNVCVEDDFALEKELKKDDEKLKMIEVKLDKMDVPWRFSYAAGKAK